MSLAQEQQYTGDKALAYATLAPVYEWFSEGLDTPDLVAARALLEVL